MLLRVDSLCAGYGNKQVLTNTSFHIDEKEIVALLGHNGAGKTTTLHTLFGLHPAQNGEIVFKGQAILDRSTEQIVRLGIALTPQGRGVFPKLSVDENLQLGAYTVNLRNEIEKRKQEVFDLFPILKERRSQKVGTMSGGQQQMVAIGMAMMAKPDLLLLDEPSIGLAPVLVEKVLDAVKEISQRFGTSILLVEQNVTQALRVADRIYVMKMGTIVEERQAEVLTRESLWSLF